MKLVIFDIDGTICNSAAIDEKCFFEAFDELYGKTIDQNTVDKFQHKTGSTDLGLYTESFRHHFNEYPDKQTTNGFKELFFEKLNQALINNPADFPEIPNAVAFIENLMAENYKIAVATGCWTENALIKLKHLDLDKFNFPLSTSDTFQNRIDIVQRAIILAEDLYNEQIEYPITFIGDGLWDLKAAEQLSLNFIGIDYNHKNTFKDYSIPVFNDYYNISEIKKFIKN